MLSTESNKDTALINKRQIERGVISKAIYMVTDSMSESEPLRVSLRVAAVDILKDDRNHSVLHLKNLLTLSAEVGIISTTNVQILLKAMNNMKDNVVKEYKEVDLESVFNNTLQADDIEYVPVDNEGELTHVSESNPETNVITKNRSNTNPSTNTSQEIEEYSSSQSKTSPTQSTATYVSVFRSSAATLQEDLQRQMSQKPVVSTVTALDIGARRKKILEVVRSKGQVTIHEFIQSIQGCSSKTIQRELTSLVLSGTLKKTGERRWSKYSLR
jgi:hypothetical protein